MDVGWNEIRSKVAVEFRILKHRPLDWFLLRGNRLVVSAGVLSIVTGILWWIVLSGLAPLTNRTPLLYLLFALLSGNFTLITIVVSINQFVLTRHMESPGEVREQFQETESYRQDIREITTESVIPVTPAGLFLTLFQNINRDIHDLQDCEWTSSEAELRRDVESLVAGLEDHSEYMVELVEERDNGSKHALFSTLEMDYSRYVFDIYQLRSEYNDTLPESMIDILNRLEQHIKQTDVARQYFKTIFIQSELASLSRLLLYIGIPVQIGIVILLLRFTATNPPAMSQPALSVAILVVVTSGFVPFILLTTYIIRLATVVQRTAAILPFTTNED